MTKDEGEDGSVALAVFELGNEVALVSINGVPTEMTRVQAFAHTIYIEGMKGKPAARKQFLELYERGKHEAFLRTIGRGW